jgi:NADH-quinone oxidoreductase subunit N
MGFVMLGLLPGTAFGFGASMYYVIVYAVMSVASFGMVILLSARGVEAERLEDFKGLNQRNPFYAAIMGLVMFSMAGVPPMVGFFAKLMVLKAVIEAGMMWLAVAAVVFAVIGAFYYLRVIKYMYFDEPENETAILAPVDFGAALTLNGIMILGLGIFSSSLIAICMASFGL